MEKYSEKGLTISKLKTFKGLEHLSDEQAERLIESLKQFARILFKVKKVPNQRKEE